MSNPKTSRALKTIYILTFLLSLHTALPAYISSSFITELVGDKLTGIVYTIASLIAIIAFVGMPMVLKRFGNFKATLVLLALLFLVVAGISGLGFPPLVILLFLIYLTAIPLLFFNLDLFLEHYSTDAATGSIRGVYLTVLNVAWLISPLLAGFILGSENRYPLLYGLAALLILPLIPILIHTFKNYADPDYSRIPFWKTLKIVLKRPDLSHIFIVSFLLQFFYAWMVIYTPIYLNEHLGIPWETIGIIFTIMLLPFVLLEYPLGKIADKWLGEKELLIGGFLIMVLTTAALTFVTTPTVWIWALLLFGTRVGASTIAVMSDTYFFKKTTDTDSHILRFFRMTGPIAYVIGPLLASLLLVFIDIRYLFLILGVIMLCGVWHSLKLHDTQ